LEQGVKIPLVLEKLLFIRAPAADLAKGVISQDIRVYAFHSRERKEKEKNSRA
jgi:hypothetical protein